MQQMDLESSFRSRNLQDENQPVDPMEEIERLRKAQSELAAKKEALRLIEERREYISVMRKDVMYRLKRALEELEKEKGYMADECNELDRIGKCFIKHYKDLDYLDPEHWDPRELDEFAEKAEKLLNRAEQDYFGAIGHCVQRLQRTKMFADQKVGKRSFIGANLSDVFFQGLVYNLPIILLGVVALVVYILKP